MNACEPSDRPVPPTPPGDTDIEGMVETLKALAHPIRMQIVRLLADKSAFGLQDESCCARSEVCVCRITELFDVSMPTISHHLRLLRQAGLVDSRREGTWVYYSLRRDVLARVGALLMDLAAES